MTDLQEVDLALRAKEREKRQKMSTCNNDVPVTVSLQSCHLVFKQNNVSALVTSSQSVLYPSLVTCWPSEKLWVGKYVSNINSTIKYCCDLWASYLKCESLKSSPAQMEMKRSNSLWFGKTLKTIWMHLVAWFLGWTGHKCYSFLLWPAA